MSAFVTWAAFCLYHLGGRLRRVQGETLHPAQRLPRYRSAVVLDAEVESADQGRKEGRREGTEAVRVVRRHVPDLRERRQGGVRRRRRRRSEEEEEKEEE